MQEEREQAQRQPCHPCWQDVSSLEHTMHSSTNRVSSDLPLRITSASEKSIQGSKGQKNQESQER